MFKFINSLVNYGVVLLLGVVSLMAGSTVVQRCLLGMAETKPQRRRFRTQLTQQPVPVPMSSSTTPPKHWSLYPSLRCPEPLH
jgi:hypothetical protein